jgi:hypothetical protein
MLFASCRSQTAVTSYVGRGSRWSSFRSCQCEIYYRSQLVASIILSSHQPCSDGFVLRCSWCRSTTAGREWRYGSKYSLTSALDRGVGRDRAAGIATRYGLDGLGIESLCGIFRTRSNRPWGPPSLLFSAYRVSFLGVGYSSHGMVLAITPHLALRLKKE